MCTLVWSSDFFTGEISPKGKILGIFFENSKHQNKFARFGWKNINM
jgi:hypothetical protein